MLLLACRPSISANCADACTCPALPRPTCVLRAALTMIWTAGHDVQPFSLCLRQGCDARKPQPAGNVWVLNHFSIRRRCLGRPTTWHGTLTPRIGENQTSLSPPAWDGNHPTAPHKTQPTEKSRQYHLTRRALTPPFR